MKVAISDGWVVVLVSHHVVVVPKPAPLAMRGKRVSLPSLPPELWICIHRLAIEDVSPLRKAYREIHDPDNKFKAATAPDARRFLKAARSLMSVCRLWNRLARELLYENVWIADTRRWASLSAALQRPNIARHVRSLRLSTTRYDHNVEALCYCPQVEMLVQPEFPRPEYLYAAPDVPLPRLHSLKWLYWVESEWSSALLEKVLRAAPNLEHIFLTSSGTFPSAGTPIEVPNLPHLKSLVLTWLDRENVYSILRTDLQHLTHLTINPVYLSAVSALPALTSLALIGHPKYALVPYHTICARCPALRELRYDANIVPEPPGDGQTAPALTYIQLHLSNPLRHYSAYSHFLSLFEAPAFAALERVVLDGAGWVDIARCVWLEAAPLLTQILPNGGRHQRRAADGWVVVLVSHHIVVVPKPAPLAMRGKRVSLPSLPPELWIHIHRLAIEDVSPFRKAYREIQDSDNSKAATVPDALNDPSVRRFFKAARSLMSVCRLWNELARELLYENVWIADTRRWASLSVALQRPEVARHVRCLRLSTTRYDHNVEALCYCPQVKMLVQPRFRRSEYLQTAPDVPLPRLHTLKYLYWAESAWSSALLEKVLSAAPNLEHIFLTNSGHTPSVGTPIEVPNLPHLKSLVLAWLNRMNVFAILRTDLQHLTHLTINPAHLEWDAVSALRALTSLALIGHSEETLVSYSTVCARCPALRELRYNANFTPEPPAVGQTAPALTYIQLHLGVPRRYSTYSHFLRFFEAPAFAALKRVVLKGPGWIYLAHAHVELGAEPLRARGCRVEVP
ncbi:hypothetical protein GGX14DRAFT_699859 [Mycena pura]|uniref:Uncharacterized protein n=1 Tax=Mycena pura TaxID=153505 RepID=A0AAD6V2P6_9AGAR|nr:hypothetical protein GGX14DRAFT_699859 [Mycena pura]